MLSVIIPVYNEEKSVKPLYASLKNVMSALGEPYEIIFVNDASDDKTREALKALEADSPNSVIISLEEHKGQSAAMQAGFDAARGELIITLDGDLQNDPEDIPNLLEKMKEGYDVVCGWRHERKDPLLKRISSGIAVFARRTFTKEKIHDVGCTLRAFKRDVLKNVYLSGSMHRFFTLIMLKSGYKIGEIKVRHHPRKFGKSKYNIRNRLFEGLAGLIRFSGANYDQKSD